MAENLNLKITIEAWADIVIKEWERKIEMLGIGLSMQLADSFYQHVYTNAAGDPVKIHFTFEWYGRMVDYGVGNGVSIINRDELIASGETKRRQKPWYSDVFFKQLAVLRHVLGEKTARNLEEMIMINLSELHSSSPTQSKSSNLSAFQSYAQRKNRR
jgi:hypothetical protein